MWGGSGAVARRGLRPAAGFDRVGVGPVGVRGFMVQGKQQVEVGHAGDGGAARDAAVEVCTVQPRFAECRGNLRAGGGDRGRFAVCVVVRGQAGAQTDQESRSAGH
jgi:hypothetical protein